MRLVSVAFSGAVTGDGDRFLRLSRALERSVEANSPKTPIEVIRPRLSKPAPMVRQRRCWWNNTKKLAVWNESVQAARDGEVVGLLDCDTLVLGDLSPVAEMPFDVAYTARPDPHSCPLNGGVFFVRVSQRSRRFMQMWHEKDQEMWGDTELHERWRRRYRGMNQSSLGWMLEEGGHGCRVLALPCAIWNCQNSSWKSFSEGTKILHIKGKLRLRCLGIRGPRASGGLATLVRIWRRYDRAARAR